MHKLKRFALKRKVLFIRTAAILLPMVLALLLLSQTAFAKNTYVITDGDRVFTYTTFATDPAAVLGEAGLELGEDDTYTTQAADGLSEITVQRSQKIIVEHHGEVMEISSMGETVGELLNRLNITLEDRDLVSLPLSEETFDGMEIRVERVVQREEIYTSNIAYEITEYYDPALPEGVREVLVEGVDGQVLCNATVTYVNGQETERVVTGQRVTSQVVNEVVAVGSGDPAVAVPNEMPIIGEDTITLSTGEVLTYHYAITCLATAYCDKGTTATGTPSRVGAIAVDPSYIPYGTRMFVITNDGQYIYGIATAEDCGNLDYIHDNRIDLFFNTQYECTQFGARECTVYILGS